MRLFYKMKPFSIWIGVILYFTALTLWMTFPLVLKMDHAIIGEMMADCAGIGGCHVESGD